MPQPPTVVTVSTLGVTSANSNAVCLDEHAFVSFEERGPPYHGGIIAFASARRLFQLPAPPFLNEDVLLVELGAKAAIARECLQEVNDS